ncbi:M56 family metallopeptidase [Flavisolibacter ginsenosidimutans]|uniref:TonB family protein n=1 Tax=Flavisolibacter ginsenosidimutans TaxID=661481 RepID=A0A5B8UGH2_9BACT|nr:M56 family metallopeptidase [Flavisolibacter ginsenosidimutans]QEC55603.1 hypothetical protein FSB75_06725 [Flavisolibacter ginsenosidimutans]
MTVLLSYLLKAVLCSGVLYLYYALALKNKIFHHWNRFYLLAAVVLSLALPLVQIAVFSPEDETNAIRFIKTVQAADDYLQNITVTAHTHSFDTTEWLLAGYATGSLVLLALFAVSLLHIKKLLQTHVVKKLDRINFVNTREPGTPFSFLRYIFWNEDISLQSETGRCIFEHELVHVTEKHTADKLFMQIVLVFFWCNPFFWLMRRELSFVHEFIADKKAVGNRGASAFAAMILQTTFPQQYSSITNSFFQLSIKRRFAMLTKQNNPKLAYAVRIVALPVLALVVFAFTVRTKEGVARTTAPLPLIAFKTDTLPKKEKQIVSVDVNKAKQLLTIYYADGSCETMTEKEATDRGLINNGGYANIQKLPAKKNITKAGIRLEDSSVKPLIVVDGTVVAYTAMSTINPNDIESINVLKGETANAKYGDKGSNGVIEITMKKKQTGAPTAVEVTGKPLQRDLTPVIVEGKPFNNNGSTITQTSTSKNEEVVVVGHPLNHEPLFEQSETPASVDQQVWRNFLEKNMQPIVENMTQNGAKKGKYIANVRFVVEKDGSLSDIQSVNTIGYGADDKIVDMMKSSPKWKPAEQNRKIVCSFHTQPITVVITN